MFFRLVCLETGSGLGLKAEESARTHTQGPGVEQPEETPAVLFI